MPRGGIGLAEASGTGLREVSSLIAAGGEGVSQAIGVGGCDLTDELGGLMMAHALEILADDPGTEVIGVLGKPPGPRAWEPLQTILVQLGQPCITYFRAWALSQVGRGIAQPLSKRRPRARWHLFAA